MDVIRENPNMQKPTIEVDLSNFFQELIKNKWKIKLINFILINKLRENYKYLKSLSSNIHPNHFN